MFPRTLRRGEHALTLLSRMFNAVEVNSSFYSLPRAAVTRRWPALVPSQFRFAVKLTQSFTHDRDRFPPSADVRQFREALEPLREEGVLGPILAQFPWSFRYTPLSVERIRQIADALPGVQRVYEVRHSSWGSDDAQAAIRGAGACCNIDQPPLRDCLGPSAHASQGVGYVRLHGRNSATWFADGLPAFERYNYLYSEGELREWVQRLNAIAAKAQEVYVFTNNHYAGQAPANALELRGLLGMPAVQIPESLLARFPRLSAIAANPTSPTLFDATGGAGQGAI